MVTLYDITNDVSNFKNAISREEHIFRQSNVVEVAYMARGVLLPFWIANEAGWANKTLL